MFEVVPEFLLRKCLNDRGRRHRKKTHQEPVVCGTRRPALPNKYHHILQGIFVILCQLEKFR